VVACWLQEHGRTPDAALAELSAKWRTVKKSYTQPASPETPEQVDWVKTWPQRRRNVQKLVLCDRYGGALVGLAVGDALGTALEFKAPGTFKPITDLIGGGPFGLEPGQWTVSVRRSPWLTLFGSNGPAEGRFKLWSVRKAVSTYPLSSPIDCRRRIGSRRVDAKARRLESIH
jgi:ADP-ribosylglycohydrolase